MTTKRNPSTKRYVSHLASIIIPCLTFLVLVTCGKDSATKPEPPAPPTPPPVQLRPTSIEITPSEVTLTARLQTLILKATVKDQNGQTMSGVILTWSSDNERVVHVSGQGFLTALNNGTATITASSGSISAQATVTVMRSAARIVIEPGSATLMSVGATVQLAASVYDANRGSLRDAVVTWTSDDVSIATVSAQGLVTAVQNGRTTITARSEKAIQAIPIVVYLPDDDADRITWRTAGQVPEHDLLAFQEELEQSMVFMFQISGYRASGFTILVGESYEALAPVFKEETGRDLSELHLQEYSYTNAFVTTSLSGGAVMLLMYGNDPESFDFLRHYIVHEYFHVLQGQLASGFELTENGNTAWHIRSSDSATGYNVAPQWMIEGLASYADFLYSMNRPGRRAFHDRYGPYDDLGRAKSEGSYDQNDLAKSVSYSNANCSFGHYYFYALSFAASQFLAEVSTTPADNFVEFWWLLGEMPTWEDAFYEAFDITFEDFVKAFPEWLAPRLRQYHQVAVQITWPDMDSNPLIFGETFSIRLRDASWNEPDVQWHTSGLLYDLDNQEIFLKITYLAGNSGSAKLELLWKGRPDGDVSLVGYYKDGGLTDNLEEATRITFNEFTEDLVWSIPGHPKTLD